MLLQASTSSKYKNEIDQTLLKEVLSDLNIVEILEAEYGVVFETASKGYFKACCPLPGHLDNTPSFYANPEQGFYKCWGCSRAGDLIKFIQTVENVNFYQAVLRVAEISGEPLMAQYTKTHKNIRNIKKSIEEYLNRSLQTDLPGGLSDTDFMFLLSKRLRKYEQEYLDVEWVDEMYKHFDSVLLNKNYKLVSKMWDELSLDIADRKKELKNGHVTEIISND